MQNGEIKIDEFKWDMNDVIGSANDTNALRNNEFYTRMKEIEDEMKHYKRHFRSKVSYCNCDDPTKSIFLSEIRLLRIKGIDYYLVQE